MNSNKLINPLLMWTIVILGILTAFLIFSDKLILERTIWSWLTLIFSALIWIYTTTAALKTHRQATSSVAAINYLVTGGIYNIIRHPMYVGDIILAWGIFFFFPTEQILVSVLWLTIILWIWMKLEERALLRKFGIEYKNYLQEVPMLIPTKNKKINPNHEDDKN